MSRLSLVVRLLLIAAIACLCFAAVATEVEEDDETTEPAPPSDVLVLDEATFDDAIQDLPIVAVEFYAPWCKHCQQLAPEWEKAATELKGKVPVAKVDCIANPEVCSAQQVGGYPTLKLFRNGEASALDIARKAEVIVRYLLREIGPAVHKLKKDELDAFLEENPTTVAAFLHNDHDDRWATFHAVALQKKHTLSFAAVLDSEAEVEPKLILYKRFEDPKVEFDGKFEVSHILEFIALELIPTLGEMNGDTYPAYIGLQRPILHVFVDPNAEGSKDLIALMTSVVKPFKKSFVAAWLDAIKFKPHVTRMGFSEDLPQIGLVDTEEGLRYPYGDKPLTADDVTKWLVDLRDGRIPPHVKSEPVPESDDGPVKIAVATTLKPTIYGDDKDVFMEFYAPWCGHCKTLAPVYEKLAEVLGSVSTLVIAKIDATANDVPNTKLNIRGFPTLLFFPAGAKDTPITYQGPRSLNGLAEFVHAHATHKFDLPELPAEPTPEKDEKAEPPGKPKSQPVPATNDGPVKVVVGDTLSAIALDATKDVLLEFYSPGCGHCVQLAPIYEQLGKAFASVPSIVIAKIDATANEVPSTYNIKYFPTILFFPANAKDTPIPFNGARNVGNFTQFLHKHASVKFDLPAPAPAAAAAPETKPAQETKPAVPPARETKSAEKDEL